MVSDSKQKKASHSIVTLTVVLVGVLVVAMSIAGTAVAVTPIGIDLNSSGPALHWVIGAYNLTFATFTLVFGSLADLFGRKRTFITGVILFSIGSFISSIADNILILDLARALAGVGGAGVMASGGAILATTFDGSARTRAFASMGAMAGVGIAIGPFLSGFLVDWLGWRATFFSYVVVGLLILLGTFFLTESRIDGKPKMDRAGMVTFVGAFSLLMFSIMQGSELGWSHSIIIGSFMVSITLFVFFVRIELNKRHPVLDFKLIKNTGFMAWCLGTLTTAVGFLGILVFLPTYLQGVNDITAHEAGFIMLFLTAPVLIFPHMGGWLVNRGLSARALITISLLLIAVGNLWLTKIYPGITMKEMVAPLLCVGIGMGISFGITDGQAMNLVKPEQVGMAAGFLNTIRGGAEALVIAVFGSTLVILMQDSVGATHLANQVAAGNIQGSNSEFLALQFTEAWQISLGGVAIFVAIAAAVVLFMLSEGEKS